MSADLGVSCLAKPPIEVDIGTSAGARNGTEKQRRDQRVRRHRKGFIKASLRGQVVVNSKTDDFALRRGSPDYAAVGSSAELDYTPNRRPGVKHATGGS